MEVDITFLHDEDCGLLSGSIAELGENAGKITWGNCMDMAQDHMDLFPEEQYDEVRDHFREYGAWEEEEIDKWTPQELVAMVIQEGASEMRTFEDHCGGLWEKYEEEASKGSIPGRMGRGDDGETYLYLGI